MPSLLRFGNRTFDPSTGELRIAGGDVVVLPTQLAAVLHALLSSPGELLTREILYRVVWQGQIVDHEHGLNYCVRQLRLILGDDARQPLFIETIRGRGYRFIADVERVHRRRLFPRRFAAAALIAGSLSLWPVSGSRTPDTALEFSEIIQEARYLENQGTIDGLRRSLLRYQSAIARDPHSTGAFIGLASAHYKLASTGAVPRLEALAAARDSAAAASKLDPANGDAHLLLGISTLYLQLDWSEAENHFRRAVSSSSGGKARLWYARSLAARGKFDRALQEAAIALAAEPESTEILGDMAWFHYFAGDYAGAIATSKRVLELDPDLWGSLQSLQLSHLALGQTESAKHVTREILKTVSNPAPALDESPAWLQNAAGKMAEACPTQSLSVEAARLYALAGNYDSAIRLLRKGLSDRTWWSPFVSIDPAFAALRREHAFREMMMEVEKGIPFA